MNHGMLEARGTRTLVGSVSCIPCASRVSWLLMKAD
jgi:hypothetical protein